MDPNYVPTSSIWVGILRLNGDCPYDFFLATGYWPVSDTLLGSIVYSRQPCFLFHAKFSECKDIAVKHTDGLKQEIIKP